MVHVAREMQRQDFHLPLLIGGATTSAKHTAVKIAPQYTKSTVHVLDASRSVGVVEKLLNPKSTELFDAENRAAQVEMVRAYRDRQETKLVSYKDACERKFPTDWATVRIDKPAFIGRKELRDVPLDELTPLIDWSPFFMTWELKGKFPKIFDDPEVGETAKKLYDDARKLLDRIVLKRQLKPAACTASGPRLRTATT